MNEQPPVPKPQRLSRYEARKHRRPFPRRGVGGGLFSANSFFQALTVWIFWAYVVKGPKQFSRNGCTFLKNNLCQLYGTGYQPLECRFCHHDRRGLGLKCHADLEKD